MTSLVYGTLRHLILLDAQLSPLLRDPEGLPPEVRDALRIAAFERLVRDTPPHAVVNEWVDLVRRRRSRLAGLANAVLRRLAPRDDLTEAEKLSLPDWLHRALVDALGADAGRSAAAMLEPEPLWLTRYHPEAAASLADEGATVAAGPVPGTLRIRPSLPLGATRAYRQGWVQPQNPSATLPVAMLAPGAGERALDLASGHGVKTAQLAAAGAEVVACELDPAKIDRARTNLARLGLRAEHRQVDLRTAAGIDPAPAVLLDAPCSGTGTLRGHPEIKLRLEADSLGGLSALQATMLEAAAALTAPGGRLVYAVCSLTRAEGPDQVQGFVERHPDFLVDTSLRVAPELAWRSTPYGSFVLPLDGLDGFFIARLRRTGVAGAG